jgi:hypothetical protein
METLKLSSSITGEQLEQATQRLLLAAQWNRKSVELLELVEARVTQRF